MDITFSCKKCGQHVVIDEAGAGLTVDCPKCGTALRAPVAQPPSIPKLRTCPDCEKLISVRAAACPHCGKGFVTATPPSASGALVFFLVVALVGVAGLGVWVFYEHQKVVRLEKVVLPVIASDLSHLERRLSRAEALAENGNRYAHSHSRY